MTALTWRTEPPDRPGWWWYRASRDDSPRPFEAVVDEGEIWINSNIDGLWPPEHFGEDGCQWAGPIEEPGEGEG